MRLLMAAHLGVPGLQFVHNLLLFLGQGRAGGTGLARPRGRRGICPFGVRRLSGIRASFRAGPLTCLLTELNAALIDQGAGTTAAER